MSFLSALLNSLPGAAAQGLIWGLMAIGVYITFRILDVADLTVDGSIATGGAAAVMLIRAGVNPWLALLCAFQNFNPRPPRGGRQQKQRKNPPRLFHYTHLCTI